MRISSRPVTLPGFYGHRHRQNQEQLMAARYHLEEITAQSGVRLLAFT